MSSVDPIEQGWRDAADAEARGCPAPALVAVAALTGPMGLPEEAQAHLAERCPHCERGLRAIWRQRLPLFDLMVEAPSAPPAGAFATALRAQLEAIDTDAARSALARLSMPPEVEPDPAPAPKRISARRTATRLVEAFEGVLVGLFFPPPPMARGFANDARGSDARPLKAPAPGSFGKAVSLRPEGPGRVTLTVDFGRLPDFGDDDALICVLREGEPEALATHRFVETSDERSAELGVDPALIDGTELRVLLVRVPR